MRQSLICDQLPLATPNFGKFLVVTYMYGCFYSESKEYKILERDQLLGRQES